MLLALIAALLALAGPVEHGKIVFVSSRGPGSTHIWLMNSDGSGQSRLTANPQARSEFGAAFSPDGRKILYALEGDDANNDPVEYFIVAAEGGVSRKVNPPAGVTPRRWTHDGRHLLGVGATGWVVLTLRGNFVRNVPGTRNNDEDLTPSPDGRQYAFTRTERVWVMRANGTGAHALRAPGVSEDSQPAWSPDGRRIAYTSVRDPAASKVTEEIWVMNADGRNQRRLTFNNDYDSAPVWSPDGKLIAYTGERPDGHFAIFVRAADPNGRGRTQLTFSKFNYPPGDFDPDWAPAR